jgi:hypothetical protein
MPRDDDDLRALWQTQPRSGARVSIDEVKSEQARLSRRVRFRNAREYVAGALVIVIFGNLALEFPLPLKVACAAIALAAVYVLVKMRRDGTVLAPPAPDAPLAEHRAHLRASLVRQRDLLRNIWRWYLGPLGGAILLFYVVVTIMLASAPGVPLGAVFARIAPLLAGTVAFVLFVGWNNRRAARKLDARIAVLDA